MYKRRQTLILFLLCSCGDLKYSDSNQQSSNPVVGSISAADETGENIDGFMAVLVERDTGISQVTAVKGGTISFGNFEEDRAYTIVLLDRDFKINAILSMPTVAAHDRVLQYFHIHGDQLPPLEKHGPIVRFKDIVDEVAMTEDWAFDPNANGIPLALDPSDSIPETEQVTPTSLAQSEDIDSDGDGIPNRIDFDIDNDGLINWFDTNMDNSGPQDVFDPDADSDAYLDNNGDTTLKNQYKEHIEFFAVTVDNMELTDLRFSQLIVQTKLRSPVQNVRILAPSGLMQDSTYHRPYHLERCSFYPTSRPYDLTLFDDGCSEDGAPKDSHFGSSFILSGESIPQDQQAIFLRLEIQPNRFQYFPYVFSKVDNLTIPFPITFNSDTHTFTNHSDETTPPFKWEVKIFNDHDEQIWSSEPQDNTVTSVAIDLREAVMIYEEAENEGYTLIAIGFAYSLDKVPGIPSYVRRSQPIAVP